MAAVPDDIQKNIIKWLPNVLGGVTYDKVRSGEITNKKAPPYISIGFLAGSGLRTKYQGAILRVLKNEATGAYDEVNGQYHKAIVSVHFRALSREERDKMVENFILEMSKHRLDLTIEYQKVRFVDILSPEIPKSIEKTEPDGKKVYRAILDLEFEYELSWLCEEPEIRAFDLRLHGENTVCRVSERMMVKIFPYGITTRSFVIQSMGYGISALLE